MAEVWVSRDGQEKKDKCSLAVWTGDKPVLFKRDKVYKAASHLASIVLMDFQPCDFGAMFGFIPDRGTCQKYYLIIGKDRRKETQ